MYIISCMLEYEVSCNRSTDDEQQIKNKVLWKDFKA